MVARNARHAWIVWLAAFFGGSWATAFLLFGGFWDVSWSQFHKHAVDPSSLSDSVFPGWGGETNRLATILQISDTHINFHDDNRAADRLAYMVQEIIPVIQPDLVVMTGDLVNAKHPNPKPFGKYSEQREEEWALYWNLTQSLRQGAFLEVPGNHDNFGSGSRCGQYDHFRSNASVSVGSCTSRVSVAHIDRPSGGTYRIATVDATLNPGPHRPFNFFGHASAEMIDELRAKLLAGEGTRTLLFGHYPLSTLSFDNRRHRGFIHAVQDIAPVTAYFAGHLHSLYDNFPGGLRTLSKSGTELELETPDLWTSAAYRMIVFDADVLAEKVLHLQEWPIIMVTNPSPVHASSVPGAAAAAASSSFIRILVYRNESAGSKPAELKVTIDGQTVGKTACQQGVNVVPWDPTRYANGAHRLDVFVDDRHLPSATVDFSLDGSDMEGTANAVALWERLRHSLMHRSNVPRLLQLAVFLGIDGSLLWLLLAERYNLLQKQPNTVYRRVRPALVLLLCSLNFAPAFIVPGMVPDRPSGAAFVFLYGTVVDGHVLPSADASIALAVFVWLALVPMTWACSVAAHYTSRWARVVCVGPLWALVWAELVPWTLNFVGSYGILAAMISPCVVPFACLALYSMTTLWNPTSSSSHSRKGGDSKVE